MCVLVLQFSPALSVSATTYELLFVPLSSLTPFIANTSSLYLEFGSSPITDTLAAESSNTSPKHDYRSDDTTHPSAKAL